MASGCSLGFLAAWQLQDGWISYMVAEGSKSKCPRDKAEAALPFTTSSVM